MDSNKKYVIWFDEISLNDVQLVGGKNASLGEMIKTFKGKDISVPNGFALTTNTFHEFIKHNNLKEEIELAMKELKNNNKTLESTGKHIRNLFKNAKFPPNIISEIKKYHAELASNYGVDVDELDLAVRSSATTEDSDDASFAGQYETYLNIAGEASLIQACRSCFASLFTDRAIVYRNEKQKDQLDISLSIGIQKMVRSDKGSAGVMFTIDSETGFNKVIVINGSWGLGENVVQGSVTPDEFLVFKPLIDNTKFKPIIQKTLGKKEKKLIYAKGGNKTLKNIETSGDERLKYVLNDAEILKLAKWGAEIEKHYGKAMDIEWAKDGITGTLFVVQARGETVESKKSLSSLNNYKLKQKGDILLKGVRVGEAISAGKACKLMSPDDIDDFVEGSILVTTMTDPDWVPIMKKAKGIVTDHGGRTCHAAIVSRELGIPAVVGTGNATKLINDGDELTLSCSDSDEGLIYKGILEYSEEEISLEGIPETKTKIMLNIGSPKDAFHWWKLPCDGIGLARMEFIINNFIKIHPMALNKFDSIEDIKIKETIQEMTPTYTNKSQFFVDKLASGIAMIASSQYPNEVILRMSDFKSNEYMNLIGGSLFEYDEENPMIGFRGACRYYSDRYKEAFSLECKAVKKVISEMGLDNLTIMIPFCRTVDEADKVIKLLEENNLSRQNSGLKIYMMCEIPANVILAEEFAKRFDGFSIGSNDLTQLTLGVDRDSSELIHLFDERNEAVKIMIENVIKSAHKVSCKVGICGQAPSDFPDFAEFLVLNKIDSISLNPDSVIKVKKRIAKYENLLNDVLTSEENQTKSP